MTILETMTSTSDSAVYEDQFTRVSAVRFITSAPFGHDIEGGLRAILDNNFKPELTDKEYFYRHDVPLELGQVVVVPARNTVTLALVSRTGRGSTHFAGRRIAARSTMKNVLAAPLELGQVVVVPARNTVTLALVSRTGLESTHFAGRCIAARSTMKKVLAALLWSPALYNLALERRDTESKKAQRAELNQQYKKARAEYDDLNARASSAYDKVSDLINKINAFERKGGF